MCVVVGVWGVCVSVCVVCCVVCVVCVWFLCDVYGVCGVCLWCVSVFLCAFQKRLRNSLRIMALYVVTNIT